MQRILIYSGIALFLAGAFWPWLRKLPFGRLPGDIVIEREHSVFYFPVTSMLLLSLVISLLLWIFRR